MCFTAACGFGVSDVYMFNNVGDRTSHCRTPVLNGHSVDVLLLNVV